MDTASRGAIDGVALDDDALDARLARARRSTASTLDALDVAEDDVALAARDARDAAARAARRASIRPPRTAASRRASPIDDDRSRSSRRRSRRANDSRAVDRAIVSRSIARRIAPIAHGPSRRAIASRHRASRSVFLRRVERDVTMACVAMRSARCDSRFARDGGAMGAPRDAARARRRGGASVGVKALALGRAPRRDRPSAWEGAATRARSRGMVVRNRARDLARARRAGGAPRARSGG